MIRWLIALFILAGCHQFQAEKAHHSSNHPTSPFQKIEGGTDIGGGSDNPDPFHKSAWFLGPDSIKLCVSTAEDFGLSEREVRKTIEKVTHKWKAYLAKTISFSFLYLLEEEQLSDEFELLDTCNGTEDITVYCGVTTAETEHYKSQFVNPTAFAQRTKYDPDTLRSKGFIWLSKQGGVYPRLDYPNYKRAGSFEALLTHEFGHALGLEHTDGTVMSENINRYVRTLSAHFLKKIDIFRPLVPIQQKKQLLSSRKILIDKQRLETIVNETLADSFSIQLERLNSTLPLGLDHHYIHIRENQNIETLPRSPEKRTMEQINVGAGLFRIFLPNRGSFWLANNSLPVFYESLVTPFGDITAMIEYGTGRHKDSTVLLSFLLDGEKVPVATF